MADQKKAADFVMQQEDSTLSGKITGAAADRGGRTRFGLAERWHPDLTKTGFFDDMAHDEALELAEKVYEEQYAPSLHLEAIEDQGIATALLSFAVLEGPTESAVVIQKASTASGVSIAVDGKIGDVTVKAINACDPKKLMIQLAAFQMEHFARIAQVNPSQSVWVKGWDNRAKALEALEGVAV